MPPVTRISVYAKPKAKLSRIVRADGLSIEVALAAPPVDGAANDELLRLLAEVLRLPKSALRLVLGQGSKRKLVEVSGLDSVEVAARLQEK